MTGAHPLTALGALTFEAADDASLERGVRALVTPTFVFRTLGGRTDLEGYLAHLHELRGAMVRGELSSLDELVDRSTDPARAAARVTVRMEMLDGSVADGEALMLGVLDGDRVATLHESGRLLAPGDDRPVATPVRS